MVLATSISRILFAGARTAAIQDKTTIPVMTKRDFTGTDQEPPKWEKTIDRKSVV